MAIEYDPKTDYYAILSISFDATAEDIKKAHRARIRELHPDRGGDTTHATAVNIARDVLSDPETRQLYDRARRAWIVEALSNPLLRAFLEPNESSAGHGHRTPQASAPPAQEAPTAGASRLHARFAKRRAGASDPRPVATGADPTAKKRAAAWKWGIVSDYAWDDVNRVFASGDWLGAIGLLGTALFIDRAMYEHADAEQLAVIDAAVAAKQRERALAIINTIADAISAHFGLDRSTVAARAGKTARKAASTATRATTASRQGTRRRKGGPAARAVPVVPR